MNTLSSQTKVVASSDGASIFASAYGRISNPAIVVIHGIILSGDVFENLATDPCAHTRRVMEGGIDLVGGGDAAHWWDDRAEARSDVTPELAEGLQAYALAQAARERAWELDWRNKWAAVREHAQMVMRNTVVDVTELEGCRIVEAVNTRGVGQTELRGAKNDRTIVWSFKSSH
ncbi:hypothetical protein B0H14DRAFT_3751007 [Mycena olivaceomarginata]|nr:hypothetical protein B0H14DRAFT_3751007 [Mycena olivaceomarginata]